MSNPLIDPARITGDAPVTPTPTEAWAASYAAEVAQNADEGPARCAAALAGHVGDMSRPMLDFGCGTGVSGLAFRLAGMDVIDGVDPCADNVAQAQARGVYRTVSRMGADLDIAGFYSAISAVGSIGAGAAPIAAFDVLMHMLPAGGMMVFSLDDHTLGDPSNIARLNEWLDCGAARLLFCENGPHLTADDMNSTVYLVEKT
jgi:SAM-dependent methyltransferase